MAMLAARHFACKLEVMSEQGDQIGPIFPQWLIVYFEQLFVIDTST
jgi:hypothetical protein